MPPQTAELRRRIAEFVERTSTEITSHDDDVVGPLAAMLPAGTVVYVAHTPKSRWTMSSGSRSKSKRRASRPRRTSWRGASAAKRSSPAPCPGCAKAALSRCWSSPGTRRTRPGRTRTRSSCSRADCSRRQALRASQSPGIRRATPRLTGPELWAALRAKQAWADRTGIAMHVVTQFGFDPAAICGWVRELGRNGVRLPVHVGMAGPTPLPKLIKYAIACGVGASVRGAMRNLRAMTGPRRPGNDTRGRCSSGSRPGCDVGPARRSSTRTSLPSAVRSQPRAGCARSSAGRAASSLRRESRKLRSAAFR